MWSWYLLSLTSNVVCTTLQIWQSWRWDIWQRKCMIINVIAGHSITISCLIIEVCVKKNNSPGVPSHSRICNLFTIDAVGYRDDNEERPDIWQSLPENQWIMGSESSLGFLPKPFGIFLVCNLHWCCFRANITPYCKPPLYFIQT